MNIQVWSTAIKEALGISLTVAKFFCVLHITDTYICKSLGISGPSMLPTFDITGDMVLAEQISVRSGKISRGDVVTIRSIENPRNINTKRVKGMEGDTITYVVDPKYSDRQETVVVPKGHIWIEGDNKFNSKDSRSYGPVPYGLLQHRVFWKIWPLEAFGPVESRIPKD